MVLKHIFPGKRNGSDILTEEGQCYAKILGFLQQKKLILGLKYNNEKELIENFKISGVYQRVEALLSEEEDFHTQTLPLRVQTWDQFKTRVPEWGRDNTFVWFRDILSSEPLQRAQKRRLCYIHAPTLLVSYLHLKLNSKKDREMINIVKWVKESLSSEDLRRHIFDDEGGDSKDVLSSFMGDGATYFIKPWFEIDAAFMIEYGPAMVSRFCIREEFLENDIFKYHGKPRGYSKGLHSMLLIGVRTDEENQKKIFLLQNWWEDKQFVECCETYLTDCRAEAVFVKNPQHLQTQFPVFKANYAETGDFIEHPER